MEAIRPKPNNDVVLCGYVAKGCGDAGRKRYLQEIMGYFSQPIMCII